MRVRGIFQCHWRGNPYYFVRERVSAQDYSEYYRILEQIFAAISAKPRIAVECDSISSQIMEVEAGRGVALVPTILNFVAGKRLLYRPLTGTTETRSVGIARATKGDVTPAGKNFAKSCGRYLSESLRRRIIR
jgi:DNA-binding transcriptional LysR family regulator